MKTSTKRVSAVVITTIAAASGALAVCYGTITAATLRDAETGEIVHQVACNQLTQAPSGAQQIGTCWYTFCEDTMNCSGGNPDKQAWKRTRTVWYKNEAPYLFTSGGPSDQPFGCCLCNPNYVQTVEPPL